VSHRASFAETLCGTGFVMLQLKSMPGACRQWV